MQFKYPEILYFLALLIIPILVHLFQLQKFKKTPFTNVAFLQKLLLQTRKSSQLKKWIILCLRSLFFASLIMAFSQPFFSDKSAVKKQATFIYLDNSLSMTSKGERGQLFKSAVQDIIENSSKNERYDLLTNDQFYQNKSSSELKEILLNLKIGAKSLAVEAILLKINTIEINKINTLYNNILISDFQNNKNINKSLFTNVTSPISLIKTPFKKINNLSVDSVFIDQLSKGNFTVHVLIKNQGSEKNNIPISIFDGNNLIAKQVFSIQKDQTKFLLFPIQNKDLFKGKISLKYNDVFDFDNDLYFVKNTTHKSTVLSIGKTSKYLAKIYTKNEFDFSQTSLKNINYNTVKNQQLIILNELDAIPALLGATLKEFIQMGGSLVLIPSTNAKISTYNSFFSSLGLGSIHQKLNNRLNITSIHYKNPFFTDVFEKPVKNFEYPFVLSSYSGNFKQQNSIVSFDNQADFISELRIQKGKFYWISAPISSSNSNFANSPLIVPVFYNFAKLSFKSPQLFYRIEQQNTVDVTTNIGTDEVLSIRNSQVTFIPQQQMSSKKVSLFLADQPQTPGIYSIVNQSKEIENIAFNYPKNESTLQFLDLEALTKNNANITILSSITKALKENNKKNEVTWLWKWFLALAIVSLFFEILILKHFKP